ncbi:hemerythrin domain-containing protein [Psychrobacter aestuarii]|uniref:Hemerythrin domain-containing protein n=1 Tax=Psychrobacter aestuarii TaxID=556327 RepID=A0ABP3FIE1_9GAMM|nr:hemerythrin domain-containing protein [Psychrobacter aestuarii]
MTEPNTTKTTEAHAGARLAPRHPDTRLDSDWLFLYQQLPPEEWQSVDYGYKTSFWLSIHADIRHSQQTLNDISALYQAGKLTWADYRKHLLPRMRQYILKLHQHHSIEDQGYFPQFVRMYPQLKAGFEILDADHVHLDTLLADWQVLNQSLAVSETEDEALAAKLHAMIAEVGSLMSQHLSDEEDLVIPILGLG